MSERKFIQKLTKPGSAAVVRENVSLAVRHSTLMVIFFQFKVLSECLLAKLSMLICGCYGDIILLWLYFNDYSHLL